ncbi:DUF1707 SHOCT-like domain-containing protein [Acrocarpospora catenulata]|uniref:DUF1707 SHOCT-like domain-containing protein n=1 Tax=Acrocarpospora catenulata TaxID=2836182 RepID=UPI001BD9221C|nr:DUF1707 domain-containing protein [Acrocarpospora catenulata]
MDNSGAMRASDAEREAVVERLRDASAEGRLTLAELTERTEAAYLARTQAELAQLTTDLPNGVNQPAAAPFIPAPRPSGRARRWYVTVMGNHKRRGKWRIDQEVGVACVMGEVLLDLREAEVRGNEVDLLINCVMGSVKIIVPDGVDVELSGLNVMSEKKVKVLEAPPGQNVPVVRIRANMVMAEIKVIGDSQAEPIKRALGAWTEWWLDRRRQAERELGDPTHGALRDAHTAWQNIHRPTQPPTDPSRW